MRKTPRPNIQYPKDQNPVSKKRPPSVRTVLSNSYEGEFKIQYQSTSIFFTHPINIRTRSRSLENQSLEKAPDPRKTKPILKNI
jgi:hypothetical protein